MANPAKKTAAKPLALPFSKTDVLVAAAQALAEVDGEIAELDAAIKKSKDHTAELSAKRKHLVADRDRASLDAAVVAEVSGGLQPSQSGVE